jgi:hypothetical protein
VGSRFDIFCSYAHSDNDAGWVDTFATDIATTYRNLTGEAPQLFIDRESLVTADIWETKIRSALESSQQLIAVISPSFIRSEWCQREWTLFAEREMEHRNQQLLADEQGLIFPVLLVPIDRGRFDESHQRFAEIVRQRQWLDVSSQLDGTPIRPDQIRRLAEQLIDTSAELEERRRRAGSAAVSAASGITIVDPASGLEWAAAVSPTAMTFDGALKWVSELEIRGLNDWRLPTKAELETIIDPAALTDDPKANPYPLRPPFNTQRTGSLHSGSLVPPLREGNYVMNVRNGHIFNGQGRKCYVRAVRSAT